jgi:hypothetical protein
VPNNNRVNEYMRSIAACIAKISSAAMVKPFLAGHSVVLFNNRKTCSGTVRCYKLPDSIRH